MFKKYRWFFYMTGFQFLLGGVSILLGRQVLASIAITALTALMLFFTILDLVHRRGIRPQWFDRQYFPFVVVLFIYCLMVQSGILILGPKLRTWDPFFLIVYSIFLLMLGNLTPRIPFKSLMGLRGRWPEKSEWVWRKTHRFAGIMTILFGFVFPVFLFIPVRIDSMEILMLVFIIIPMAIIYGTGYIYAFVIGRKEFNKTKRR